MSAPETPATPRDAAHALADLRAVVDDLAARVAAIEAHLAAERGRHEAVFAPVPDAPRGAR